MCKKVRGAKPAVIVCDKPQKRYGYVRKDLVVLPK